MKFSRKHSCLPATSRWSHKRTMSTTEQQRSSDEIMETVPVGCRARGRSDSTSSSGEDEFESDLGATSKRWSGGNGSEPVTDHPMEVLDCAPTGPRPFLRQLLEPRERPNPEALFLENDSQATGGPSKKPNPARLYQQKLPACQLMLTSQVVFPVFIVVGIIFIIIGAALIAAANSVTEIYLDYSSCTGFCIRRFTLDSPVRRPVFFYYSIVNFYQNHRMYAKSRDHNQLVGAEIRSAADLDDNCKQPFRSVNGTPIAPCGAIANSKFNDTIRLFYSSPTDDWSVNVSVPLSDRLIAWKTDRTVLFKNPSRPGGHGSLEEQFEATAKPIYWPAPVYQLSNQTENNGYLNEDLMVWMKVAALPSFRKLWRRVDHDADDSFKEGLPRGNYTIHIESRWPVGYIDAQKAVVVSNTAWIGGRNNRLGIGYLVVGCFVLLGVVVLFVVERVFSEKTNKVFCDVDEKTPFHK